MTHFCNMSGGTLAQGRAVAGPECIEYGASGAFPAHRDRNRAKAARQVVGSPRDDQPGCLLAKKGKRDEVGAMFAGIYNWFTERFDTRRPERSEGAARRIGPLAG